MLGDRHQEQALIRAVMLIIGHVLLRPVCLFNTWFICTTILWLSGWYGGVLVLLMFDRTHIFWRAGPGSMYFFLDSLTGIGPMMPNVILVNGQPGQLLTNGVGTVTCCTAGTNLWHHFAGHTSTIFIVLASWQPGFWAPRSYEDPLIHYGQSLPRRVFQTDIRNAWKCTP